MARYDGIARKLSSGQMVLLDGGIGTEVIRRGVRWRWYGLKTDAAIVQSIHHDYASSGADVLKTNTFGLTKRLYLNVFHDLEHMRRIGAPGLETRAAELSKVAVDAARNGSKDSGRDPVIAGSLGPIQHCFRPDMAPGFDAALAEHRETARILKDCGVDMILLEMMNTIDEAAAATQAAKETELWVWVSFVPNEHGNLLSGETIADAVKRIEPLEPAAFLVNGALPDDITKAVRALKAATKLPIGAFAIIGFFDPPSWKFEFQPQFVGMEQWPPERYIEVVREWRALGAQIVGGCNGTGPEHIRAIQEKVH